MMHFKENDPFHFGNLLKASLSVWRIETGDGWEQIMRINAYGCMYYPLGYPMLNEGFAKGNECHEEVMSFEYSCVTIATL